MTMNGTTNIRCCWERVHTKCMVFLRLEKLYSGAGLTALEVRDSTENCSIRLWGFPLFPLKRTEIREKVFYTHHLVPPYI